MSYRTCINGYQIFGNNEWYDEWGDFLKSKGIEIDECGLYDGEIDDLQGMFDVIDKITRKLINERHEEVLQGKKDWKGNPYRELTDLSQSIWLDDDTPLLKYNMQMIRTAYCFLPYQAFKAVEDMIEPTGIYKYKLKEGKKIPVCAS